MNRNWIKENETHLNITVLFLVSSLLLVACCLLLPSLVVSHPLARLASRQAHVATAAGTLIEDEIRWRHDDQLLKKSPWSRVTPTVLVMISKGINQFSNGQIKQPGFQTVLFSCSKNGIFKRFQTVWIPDYQDRKLYSMDKMETFFHLLASGVYCFFFFYYYFYNVVL